jgi:hypothetical protein
MVSIAFVYEKYYKNQKIRNQIDYHISEFTLRNNFKQCLICKNNTQKIYSIEVWKNSELIEHHIYCKNCFYHQLRLLKKDIYDTYWNTLIFLINNYSFIIERTNLLRERCDFCFKLYTRFKIKLYPIALENQLCIRCFKNKLEEILLDFERNIFII